MPTERRQHQKVSPSMSAHPKVTHVLETSLYVRDLDRAERFYSDLFGFEQMLRDERMCALAIPGQQVLLLFRHGASVSASPTPFGDIPPHDGRGTQHLCFAIAADQLDAWEDRLAQAGIVVESRLDWPQGATSLYFRDPDGHSLELATPKLWPNYTG
jgi:catechol 2,3-dioxygenase-like lactoylglutathione lyase family enzyme